MYRETLDFHFYGTFKMLKSVLLRKAELFLRYSFQYSRASFIDNSMVNDNQLGMYLKQLRNGTCEIYFGYIHQQGRSP